MVQILVHVRPADAAGEMHFELIECQTSTSISEIKHKVEELGRTSGKYDLPSKSQELVFMGERCMDGKALCDYGICEEFIMQVTGFVVNPDKPGQKFVEGRLVPCDT